jgi:acyl-CoA synthetase (AMP-forming)/AMP-acid ligase II
MTDSTLLETAATQPNADGPPPAPENFYLALLRTARRVADRGIGINFLGFGVPDTEIPYERFLGMAGWLGDRLPPPADERAQLVVIAANDPLPTLLAFLAALATDRRPLILPGPSALGGPEPFLQRIRDVLSRCAGYGVLALEQGLVPDDAVPTDAPVVMLATDASAYGVLDDPLASHTPSGCGDDVAFLQMTSASTGDSKLVAISHANAHANLASLRISLGGGDEEYIATWLPLYHDMGLVGTTLLSFYQGWRMCIMKPTEFIMRPHRWIETLSRLRCTITAGPNFGYDHTARSVTDAQVEGCDLSALRSAVVGAEPIRLATMEGFARRFARHGLRAESLVCSYGMAESTLATAMKVPAAIPRYLVVDPGTAEYGKPVTVLAEGTLAPDAPDAPLGEGDRTGVAVFSCGPALDGIQIGLVDGDGDPISGDCVLGEITLRGSSIFVGYFDYAAARPGPLPGGQLHTGDLGFLQDGELFILDRAKHVIIRHGRNYLASLIEERIGAVLGVPSGRLILVDADIHDPASDIVVVVENEPRAQEPSAQQAAALRELDLPVDRLLFCHKRVIPRTTSGKKRYEQTRRRLAEQAIPITLELRVEPVP